MGRSSREKWVNQREQFRNKVVTKGQQAAITALGDSLAERLRSEEARLRRIWDDLARQLLSKRRKLGAESAARLVHALVALDRELALRRGLPTMRIEDKDPLQVYQRRRELALGLKRITELVDNAPEGVGGERIGGTRPDNGDERS